MAKKKLTTTEKWTIGLSLTAIIVSMISPITSYYWFDPQFQTFRNRARLQISSTNPINFNQKEPKPVIEIDLWEIPSYSDVEILNIGQLPAKDVQIVFNYTKLVEDEKLNPSITFEPPILSEITIREKTVFVTLKKAIAPQEKIKVKINPIPDNIWVYNEFGEGNSIQTNIELIRDYRT